MREIWQALNNINWVALLQTHGLAALRIIFIFFAAYLLLKLGTRLIERSFKTGKNASGEEQTPNRKAQTLDPLFKQIWRYFVIFVTLLLILEQAGVRLGPILTTAGVAGIAIGFGAQRLVRDIITGFFLIFDNKYAVGDYITIGPHTGTVEEISLMATRLRDLSGDLHIIPNGSVENITNHARSNIRALVNIPVACEEDIDRVIEVLKNLSAELSEQLPEIVEGPTVLGIVELGKSEAVIQMIAQTEPLQQRSIERELRRAIMKRFEQEGINLSHRAPVDLP